MINNVTIIVPTRNEAHNIVTFLSSVPAGMPLIVVDSSEDDTPTLIESTKPHHTRVLRRRINVTAARQLGAEHARTEWLLFTDADIVFGPTYFEQLAYSLNTAVSALYGPKLSQDDFQTHYRQFSWGMAASHQLGIPAVSGSNFLVRRDAFWDVGGFDLRLTCNEDSELGWRLKQQGHTIEFDRNLIVYARDHRRLYRGTVRKTAHSVTRCLLLFSGLMPNRWRTHDWGYWRSEKKKRVWLQTRHTKG